MEDNLLHQVRKRGEEHGEKMKKRDQGAVSKVFIQLQNSASLTTVIDVYPSKV